MREENKYYHQRDLKKLDIDANSQYADTKEWSQWNEQLAEAGGNATTLFHRQRHST